MIGSTNHIRQPDGSLRCSCGSTQFHAGRSTAQKMALGVASLALTPRMLTCLSCGKR